MSKIFIILLVIFCLLNYLTSQQNSSMPIFDFSTIPANQTLATECGLPNPQHSTDCTQFNNMFTYCCYMTSLSKPNFCQPILPTKYQTSITSWTVNDTSFGINCDIKEGSLGSPCGVVDPKNYTDCTKYSTSKNSCCFYKNSTLDLTYCFWMGTYFPYSPINSVQCTPPISTVNSANYFGTLLIAFIILSILLL
jgi:hypothetical protein